MIKYTMTVEDLSLVAVDTGAGMQCEASSTEDETKGEATLSQAEVAAILVSSFDEFFPDTTMGEIMEIAQAACGKLGVQLIP